VNTLLGPRWADAAGVVQIFALCGMLQFTRLYTGHLVVAAGRPILNTISVAFGFLITIGGILVFGAADAVDGALIWSARYAATLPLGIALATWATGLSAGGQLLGLVVPGLSAGVMCAAMYGARSYMLAGWSSPSALLISIPIGGLVYAVLIALLRPNAAREFYALLLTGLSGRSGREMTRNERRPE
jgi:hypothetical protein